MNDSKTLLGINQATINALQKVNEKLMATEERLHSASETFFESYDNQKSHLGIYRKSVGNLIDNLNGKFETICECNKAMRLKADQCIAWIKKELDLLPRHTKDSYSDKDACILTSREKEQIQLSIAKKNDRKLNLPITNGHWKDPDMPGNSMWMPDPNAEYTYKEETIKYRELLQKYGIEGLEYKGELPIFHFCADKKLGSPWLEIMPNERLGSDGSFTLAEQWVVEHMKGFSSVSDVRKYMRERDLVWHEKDLHSVIAIPGDIHRAFPHIGGIGLSHNLVRIVKKLNKKRVSKRFTIVKGTLKSWQ